MSDKRAVFFAGSALACLLLVPVAEHEFRALTVGVAATYVLLALASWLDHRGRHRPPR
jgi:predicted PurR-regulated permease PerM